MRCRVAVEGVLPPPISVTVVTRANAWAGMGFFSVMLMVSRPGLPTGTGAVACTSARPRWLTVEVGDNDRRRLSIELWDPERDLHPHLHSGGAIDSRAQDGRLWRAEVVVHVDGSPSVLRDEGDCEPA